jgi:hypothetical protein
MHGEVAETIRTVMGDMTESRSALARMNSSWGSEPHGAPVARRETIEHSAEPIESRPRGQHAAIGDLVGALCPGLLGTVRVRAREPSLGSGRRAIARPEASPARCPVSPGGSGRHAVAFRTNRVSARSFCPQAASRPPSFGRSSQAVNAPNGF